MPERKLLFISVFNHGAIELAKNHLQSLISHGITNYRAYCTDIETENELKLLNYNVEKVEYNNVDETKHDFGTTLFNKLSYLRYNIMMKLLNEGYDIWYMDTDTVVLDNLNHLYEQYRAENKANIWFQSDINMLCTGCMLVFNTPSSINLIRQQCDDKVLARSMGEDFQYKYNDQLIMNHIIKSYKGYNSSNIGVFPIFQFPNGLLFFKDDYVKTEVPQYITLRNQFHASNTKLLFVHANWMVGVDTKINALKAYGLWNVVE
jgi:hypothetical protein